MTKSRSKWICLDCKVDTGKIYEHYFLKQSVWDTIHTSIKGMLCIGCAEQRLGRKLTKDDFTDCYINSLKGKHSLRLLSRLRGS